MPRTPLEVFRFLAALKKAGVKPHLRRVFAEVMNTVIGPNPARSAMLLDVIPRELKDAFQELGFTAPSDAAAFILDNEEYVRLEHLLEVCIFVASANEEVFKTLSKLLDTDDYKTAWKFLAAIGTMDAKVLEKLYEVYSPFGKSDKPNWSKQAGMIRDYAPKTTDGS